MSQQPIGFFKLARSKPVFVRALKVALTIGTLLALINHGDTIFGFSMSSNNLTKILLTYLVPFGVSTYSSVRAIQANHSRD